LLANQEFRRQLSGIIMLILTDRELEFLASFNANWRRIYWNELARLLKEGGQPMRCPARSSPHRSTIQSRERLDPEESGQILTLALKSRECDKS
jgi:hypothetical protein